MQGVQLLDILPEAIKRDKTIIAICESLQPLLDKNWRHVDLISIYKNLDMMPSEILDHIAYMFHVDFYSMSLDRKKKIDLIRNSIKHHRYKGTPWAVENLLSILYGKAWIKEWFEYGGKPYYFKIQVEYRGDKLLFDTGFFKALYSIKNTRSWLDVVEILFYDDLILQDSHTDWYSPLYKTGTDLWHSGQIYRQAYMGELLQEDLVLGSDTQIPEQHVYSTNEIYTGEVANDTR